MNEFDETHRQSVARVRFEWGPTGARATQPTAVAVVVDVLSFTTSVSVGVEREVEIYPARWRDERAATLAQEVGADLARTRADGLSPVAMAERAPGRLVLPSPNGATVSALLAEEGAVVVAGALRNATSVARWILASGAESVAVIAAGERWPDDTLRPAVEDLWGAGAVISALTEGGMGTVSPEAQVAADAFRAVRDDLAARLAYCASGRELVARGFAGDVRIAADLDASAVVPVLRAGRFTSGKVDSW